MEVDMLRDLHNVDQTSDCQSFSSRYHSSAQSRKVSIGIMADQAVKLRSKEPKGYEQMVPNATKINSDFIKNSVGSKRSEVGDSIKRKQVEASLELCPPWISTRHLYEKTPLQESLQFAKETSTIIDTIGKHKKLNTTTDAPMPCSAPFFAKQNSAVYSGGSRGKNLNNGSSQYDGCPQRVEEFTFSTANKVILSDNLQEQGKPDKVEAERTKTLRMKLCEILGTGSSPNRQSSQVNKVDGNNQNPKQIVDQNCDTNTTGKGTEIASKPKQNSDPIETDSESNEETKKKPVTRSLSRKRSKVQPLKTKGEASIVHREKHPEKNIFSSIERLSQQVDGVINGRLSGSITKKYQRRSSKIEPRKICFPKKNHVDEIPKETLKTESLFPPVGTSPLCDNPEDGLSAENEREANMHLQAGLASTPAQDNEAQHEDTTKPFSKNILEPQYEYESPTFKLKTPSPSSSPSSQLNAVQIEKDFCSPVLTEEMFKVKNIRSFQTSQTPRQNSLECNADSESSDDTEQEDTTLRKSPHVNRRKTVMDNLSKSSSEEGNCQRYKESSPRDHGGNTFSPETGTVEKLKFKLFPSKKFENLEGSLSDQHSLTLPSRKGIREDEWIHDPLEEKDEGDLERVVKLFCLALQKIKIKMQSATRKKSTEILASTSAEVHQQLQNIGLQIQSDVGKITSMNKSKRKHLELRLQEQQEKLKSVHEKFEEDVHHHLQECQSTLEGLGENEIELEGIVKKQKASHQKLILQVEAAVESQVKEAQKRITTIHKLARDQMLQLKHAIAECLQQDT